MVESKQTAAEGESATSGGVLARGLGSADELPWQLVRASAKFELKYGKALVEPSRRPGPIPVYGSNGVTGWHDTPLFNGPGVVLGRKGMGNLGVEWVDDDFWVIDTAYSLNVLDDDVDLKFAYYLVGHVGLNHLKHGSSNPSLTREAFGSQLFPLPELEEQKRIASVLSSFDDLITSELSTSRLADELWRAVLRNALSEDSVKLPLSSLARFVNGRNFTRDATGYGLPVIRTPEVRSGPSDSTVRNNVEVDDDRIARVGDILFVWSGSLMVSRWHWEPGLINQHVFKVLPLDGIPDWLVMFAIEELMDDFLGVAADKATTMGHIKRSDLDRQVTVPPRSTWFALDEQIAPLWDDVLSARAHTADLIRVRDDLLPLLLSGKVRVSESLEVA